MAVRGQEGAFEKNSSCLLSEVSRTFRHRAVHECVREHRRGQELCPDRNVQTESVLRSTHEFVAILGLRASGRDPRQARRGEPPLLSLPECVAEVLSAWA